MHCAYTLGSLLKLPHAIQTMRAFAEYLLVGTKQGHLLLYSVEFEQSGDDDAPAEGRIQLLRSNTDNKKPISQMDIQEVGVKQYILVVLSDGVVSVHYISLKDSSVPSISSATKMPLTKGTAVAFALDVVRQKTLTGVLSSVIRIAIAVRKKLHFFYWKKEKFHDLHGEVSIPYEAKSVEWCRDVVCVSFVGGYCLIKMNKTSGENICELFSAGIKNQSPCLLLQKDQERFAYVEDKQTKFIDLDGNAKKKAISWSDVPVDVAHDAPYFVGLLKKNVEVRTENPELLVQAFDVPEAKLVCNGSPGLLFLASASQVWYLRMVSTKKQICQLLQNKYFELAIQLSNLPWDKTAPLQKSDGLKEIQTLYAFHHFCNGKFKEAMDDFFKLDIDASNVIGLFPDLLPQEFRNQLKYPEAPPTLDELVLDSAYLALIEFLTQVRHKLNGCSHKKICPAPISPGSAVIESKSKMLEIIDTTLLKCYLRTNDALVSSLLRLKDNQCHLEETERTLKKHKKYAELVVLYNTRDLHRRALALMKDHMEKEDSPLKGIRRTVTYLQNLSVQHIDIVFEYARPVLNLSEKDGLSIFTEDLLEVESWPRERVLEFLFHEKKVLVVPYLEHIISTWNEKEPLFHNALILQYKDNLVDLYQMLDTSVEQEDRDQESDLRHRIQSTRKKLSELLQSSTCYTSQVVLQQFPTHCLFEERAVLLGSLGRHLEALAIYLFQVRDVSQALDYCHKSYTTLPGHDVYNIMYRLLVQPPDSAMLKAMNLPSKEVLQPDLDAAMKLLDDHEAKIDLMTVVLSTPAAITIQRLSAYLERAMERRVSARHNLQLLRGLLHSQHLQLQEERVVFESQKICLGEFDRCPVCHKRFRNQGHLVRFPNGKIVHFSCQDRAMIAA